MKKICIYILISCLFFDVYSQRRKNNKNVNPATTKEEKISLSALKLRNIGPAFLSGRISDIAIHPKMIMYGTLQLDQVVYGKQKIQVLLGNQSLIENQLIQQVVSQSILMTIQ